MKLPPTPSQTVGPFFHIAIPWEGEWRLVAEDDPNAMSIEGTVWDGAGDPAPDALVEIWQPNRAGRFAHPEDGRSDIALEEGFTGFGRCATDEHGRFRFVTVKPGPVPGPGGRMQAPHINVGVFARGLLKRLVTRIYFPDEEEANGTDPVLSSIDDPELRASLIARSEENGLRFDIRMQGDRESVFFDI
jgi:protocatechuate 3,4-dioxygenase alpha subunit